jgi:hypothetical protein
VVLSFSKRDHGIDDYFSFVFNSASVLITYATGTNATIIESRQKGHVL